MRLRTGSPRVPRLIQLHLEVARHAKVRRQAVANIADFIGDLDTWGIETVDLLAGGVPCQPFSRAGSSRIRDLVASGLRTGHDTRADHRALAKLRAGYDLPPENSLVVELSPFPSDGSPVFRPVGR